MIKNFKTHQITKEMFYWIFGIILFLLPLFYAWACYPLGVLNNTSYSALGGMLPWSDAAGYYSSANTFLEKGILDVWSVRRPLNAVLFSIRLWLADNNFQMALIVQALLCGISCLLVAKCIKRSFGMLAGIVTLFVLFLFAAVFIPTILTETLGLTIGCLSFVVLWEAINLKNSNIKNWVLFFTAGLLLTVGLNTRAGAFFILPILILWLGYNFRNDIIYKKNKLLGFNWFVVFSFIFGITCGFIFNLMLIKLYSYSGDIEVPHANFAYTLFGLVSGGKNWTHIYNIKSDFALYKTEAEQAKYLYMASWEVFKNNPLMLLKGFLVGCLGVIKKFSSFFSVLLVINNNIVAKIIVRCLGFIVLFFGLFRLYNISNFFKNNTYANQSNDLKNKIGLINIALISMFLSAGVIWIDGGFRVFAVTVPFFASACGIILGYRLTTANPKSNNKSISFEAKNAIVFSYALLILGLIGPKLIQSISVDTNLNVTQAISKFSCSANENKMIVKNIAGVPKVLLPLYLERFKKTLLKNQVESKDFLKMLQSNIITKQMFLGSLYDLNSTSTKYILGTQEVFLNNSAYIGLCVAPIANLEHIMQARSFEVLDEK